MRRQRPSTFMDLKSDMREQDANEWWSNTVEIFKSLVEQAGHDIVKRIRGISISSHTVTMLPVDAEGNPLRNGITCQGQLFYRGIALYCRDNRL